MDEPGTILRFPPQLRVVALAENAPEPLAAPDPALVDHGGQAYRLAELLACLSPAELEVVETTAPRTGQAAWDEVVRRWPRLAAEIVAVCQALSGTKLSAYTPGRSHVRSIQGNSAAVTAPRNASAC